MTAVANHIVAPPGVLKLASQKVHEAHERMVALTRHVDQACRSVGEAKARFAAASPTDPSFPEIAGAVAQAEATLSTLQERERLEAAAVTQFESELRELEDAAAAAKADAAIAAVDVQHGELLRTIRDARSRARDQMAAMAQTLRKADEKVGAVSAARRTSLVQRMRRCPSEADLLLNADRLFFLLVQEILNEKR